MHTYTYTCTTHKTAHQETRTDLEGMQAETKQQQQDIDALARRNTELVGVRASLARRLNAAVCPPLPPLPLLYIPPSAAHAIGVPCCLL